jgi:hypothetical protein
MLPKKPAEIFFSLKMFFLHFWRDAYSLENLKKKKKKKNEEEEEEEEEEKEEAAFGSKLC